MRDFFGRSLAVAVLLVVLQPGVSPAYQSLQVLGDSLSDVGNLFIATQPPFPGGPLPQDPPYFEGRFSDGPIYAEYLWEALGLPGTIAPSFAGGTNYAVGGARTRYHALDNTIPGFNPLTVPTSFPELTLLGQRDLLLFNNAGVLEPADLHTVWIGSNDVRDATLAVAFGAPMSFAQDLVAQSVNDLLSVVGDMVTAGATDFLIPTVPDLGLTPEMLALSTTIPDIAALATALSQSFNDLVDLGLTSVSADITRLDVFSILRRLVADPSEFGLPSTLILTEPCFEGFVGEPGPVCTNPEDYAFFDKIHPSAVTHAVLGELAANAVPAPMILLLMASGIVALQLARGRLADR